MTPLHCVVDDHPQLPRQPFIRSLEAMDESSFLNFAHHLLEKMVGGAPVPSAATCGYIFQTITATALKPLEHVHEKGISTRGDLFAEYLRQWCYDQIKRGRFDKYSLVAEVASESPLQTSPQSRCLAFLKLLVECAERSALPKPFVSKCIKDLLGMPEAHIFEVDVTCQFLHVAGKALDKPFCRPAVDVHFSLLRQLSEDQTLPNRQRYKLKEVIAVRASKWGANRPQKRQMPLRIEDLYDSDSDVGFDFSKDRGSYDIRHQRDGFNLYRGTNSDTDSDVEETDQYTLSRNANKWVETQLSAFEFGSILPTPTTSLFLRSGLSVASKAGTGHVHILMDSESSDDEAVTLSTSEEDRSPLLSGAAPQVVSGEEVRKQDPWGLNSKQLGRGLSHGKGTSESRSSESASLLARVVDNIIVAPKTREAPLEESTKESAQEASGFVASDSPSGTPSVLQTKRRTPTSSVSTLANAQAIKNISVVPYPDGILGPRPDLNLNAKDGKFRYDRDFLLQFKAICLGKPDCLPPLDAIGLGPPPVPSYPARNVPRAAFRLPGASSSNFIGDSRHRSDLATTKSSRLNKHPIGSHIGVIATPGASKLGSEDRLSLLDADAAAANGGCSNREVLVNTIPGMMQGRGLALQQKYSQGLAGGGGPPVVQMTLARSKHEEKKPESEKARMSGSVDGQENRRDGLVANINPPEIVERKIKGLLNKLTMEKFDSISDQVIAWANVSEEEKDARSLAIVIKVVFEEAVNDAARSEMYARLCRKTMEQICPKVQDNGVKNAEGKPITGGQLFRKYLLNRCQEEFERGWAVKEATTAAAATKAMEDQAAKAANDKNKEGEAGEEIVLYSEGDYAAQKAKRQGLGLIKFIGELFKLQMLTERIMHECVKKLLGNVENPEEEEIESLCTLLSTVGQLLDTQKARAHMDVYFSRMKELVKSGNVTSRMQFMLQDVIELRQRGWVTRKTVDVPTTLAQIHENAAKEKADKEKEASQRHSMSRGRSRRGGERSDFPQPGPDGWAAAPPGSPRPPPKAGDLSNFRKISKAMPMTFGPTSVFSGQDKVRNLKRDSLSRSSTGSDMFSMLQNGFASGAHRGSGHEST